MVHNPSLDDIHSLARRGRLDELLVSEAKVTKDQLDALIEFVRDIANTAVNDPLGEAGAMYQAEKRLRAAFTVEPSREPVIPFVHWSKDPMIPYDGCGCSSCQDMRRYRGDVNRGADT